MPDIRVAYYPLLVIELALAPTTAIFNSLVSSATDDQCEAIADLVLLQPYYGQEEILDIAYDLAENSRAAILANSELIQSIIRIFCLEVMAWL